MPPPATLDTSIRYLKGVGLERSAALARMGYRTLEELFTLFPRRYEDRRPLKRIAELSLAGKECVMGIVSSRSLLRTKNGQTIFRVAVADGRNVLFVSWFNMPYLAKVFLPKTQVILYGAAEKKGRRVEMVHPEYEVVTRFSREATVHSGRLTPVYPLTEELGQKGLRQIMFGLTHEHTGLLRDPLPEPMRRRLELVDAPRAYADIHFPPDDAALSAARRRLVFDEFFTLMLAVQSRRKALESKGGALGHSSGRDKVEQMIASLGFRLTGAQERAVDDILTDMERTVPMQRLVQGDVGSGKTAVAAAALAFTAANGFQGALMAPTEVLAQQHFYTLTEMLEPLGVRVEYLAGSLEPHERKIALLKLAEGRADIAVGTHALVQEGVRFHKLGLAVVDEQHKFGVFQRSTLKDQLGGSAHFLLLSATPIPRSLALTLYGDLDLTVISERPKGRQPVETMWVDAHARDAVYRYVESELERGRQAFFICPRVSSHQDLQVKTALQAQAELSARFKDRRVGLLHGRLKAADKNRVMREFKDRQIDVLVSTVVIEVGIDVPNATVMVIENAELFGLAQLHQLRGRIGRGSHASFCFIFSEDRDEETVRRLEAFTGTDSGFEIAEADLGLRGSGTVAGGRQHGRAEFRIGDLVRDLAVLETARREAAALVGADPRLERPEHAGLRRAVEARFGRTAEKAAASG